MSAPAIAAFKPMTARGRSLGEDGAPALCVPLIGSALGSLLAEVKSLIPSRPDVFEWRADRFAALASLDAVAEAALALRRAVGGAPFIFTLRSPREGGAPQPLDAQAALRLSGQMASAALFDFVDLEIAADEAALRNTIAAAKAAGTQVILSSHDFATTPPVAAMLERLRRMSALGADVAKLAVMPGDPADVLRLLEATRQARVELDLPLVTMAMGPLGVASRAFGHLFGSSMTFASGLGASAPGQLPIDDLRKILQILRAKNPPR